MARNSKPSVQPELPPAPAVTAVPVPEMAKAVVFYQPLTTSGKWRVGQWELLQAEFPRITEELLPWFHAELVKHKRSWVLVRRLFGIGPVMVDTDDPDENRTWSRAELCDKLGIDARQMQAELEHVRSMVSLPAGETDRPVAGPKFENKAQPNLLIQETDDELLRRYGYVDRLFEVMIKRPTKDAEPRSAEENKAERDWFAARVRQFRKVLDAPLTGRLADQALRNELRIRRAEEELSLHTLGTKEYREFLQDKEKIEQSYRNQLAEIDKMAPWFNASEKQASVKETVSELIRAVQEYQGRGDTKLLDGIYTAYELQVCVRTSKQHPFPLYRPGLVAAINESRKFLWDPNGASQLRPLDLMRLDRGFQEAVVRLNEETIAHVPDLEREGPEGEFEDIPVKDEVGEQLDVRPARTVPE